MAVPIRVVAVAMLAAAVCVASGCKPDDDIRSYSVPKEPTAKEKKPDAPADEKYRMLGAIIPAEPGYYWFVKFVGPSEVVTPHEVDFTAFVKSIKPDPAKPTWTVPAGWSETPPKPTRLVTLKNGPAEFYLSGPFGGTLLSNVNRWRKEVGLRDLAEAELKGGMTELTLGDKPAYTVDLRGPSWSGGMMGGGKGPFQK